MSYCFTGQKEYKLLFLYKQKVICNINIHFTLLGWRPVDVLIKCVTANDVDNTVSLNLPKPTQN